jgi:hypothetical protein
MRQLLEDALGLLLVASEANGMLSIDRAALGIESVLDRCIGHNLKIFEDAGLWDAKTMKLLKKANAQRNHLVHRFILDNFTDMISPIGRDSVNEKLFRIFTNIRLALRIVTPAIVSWGAFFGKVYTTNRISDPFGIKKTKLAFLRGGGKLSYNHAEHFYG